MSDDTGNPDAVQRAEPGAPHWVASNGPVGLFRRRWWGVAVTVLMAVAVAWPGVRLVLDGRDAPDGFPLSTFPMFTTDRGRIVELPAVIAVDADDLDDAGEPVGTVRRLSPMTIADTDQVIEAHNVVRRAINRGEAASADLCDEVATRIRDGADDDADDDAVVQVVIERYDAIAWSAGQEEPQQRRVMASC